MNNKAFNAYEQEITYLRDMIQYLNQEGNTCSEDGEAQLREVFDRILSRPVMDIEIDPIVFEEFDKQNQKEGTN